MLKLKEQTRKQVILEKAHKIAEELAIHGRKDKYCLPKFVQQVYDEAGEPKEILWLDTTNHIDLYDNEKYVGPAINKIVE